MLVGQRASWNSDLNGDRRIKEKLDLRRQMKPDAGKHDQHSKERLFLAVLPSHLGPRHVEYRDGRKRAA